MACSFEEMKTNSEDEELFNVICAQDTVSALKLYKIQRLVSNEFVGLNFASSTLDEEELEKRSTFILKNVLKNKLALRLLRHSLSKGNVLVIFKSDVCTGAKWIKDRRQIEISDTQIDPYGLMDCFIFELNNSVNTINPFDYKDAEIYALDVIIANYKTIQKTRKILQFGIAHCQWLSDDCSSHNFCSTPVEYLVSMCRPLTLHGFSQFDVNQLEYFNVKIEHLNEKIEAARRALAQIRVEQESYEAYVDVIDASLLRLEEILRFPKAYGETEDTIIQLQLQQRSARDVARMDPHIMSDKAWMDKYVQLKSYKEERAILVAQKKAVEEGLLLDSQDIEKSACVGPIYNPLVFSGRLSLQKSGKANVSAVGQEQLPAKKHAVICLK